MDEGTLGIMISSFVVLAVFVGLLIWGLVNGQFKDIEEPKYRIFEIGDFEDDDKKGGNKNG